MPQIFVSRAHDAVCKHDLLHAVRAPTGNAADGKHAGGAQIVVFSTGRGTPTGNPLAPVIKITGNKLTYANMIDNIDVDASPLIYGTKTIEELGQELLKLTQEVACGKQTKAESLGYTEMAIARVCNFV